MSTSSFELEVAEGAVQPGFAYFTNTPCLASHHGSQPDLFATWNAIPLGTPAVDVVLYLHGFALSDGQDAPLAEFVRISGLGPGAGGHALATRTRPTLALIPRGDASPTPPYDGGAWPYYFPALDDNGAAALISGVLDGFATARRALGDPLSTCDMGRFLVMGHSGGGKGVRKVLASPQHDPDEVHLFDALYEVNPDLKPWIDRCFSHPDADRRLSIHYTDQTHRLSERVADYIETCLATAARPGSLRSRLLVEEAGVRHMKVPRQYMPTILADRPAPVVAAQDQGRRTPPSHS